MNRRTHSGITRRELLSCAAGASLLGACRGIRPSGDVLTVTMKRATEFVRKHCAFRGGYVWAYAADFSRRWGEMEAYPTMIWIQPPGTATVGHLFLDCYHATADEYYYDAACEVAAALVAAQHPSGGWNYMHDFAGVDSIRRWYDTIGRNGWRLEEFHHYYGNATFDDAGTIEAASFFLRLYLEERDERYGKPLELAIRFVTESQYENGGWPQRYPFVEDMPELHGMPDYTRQITFNDDVAGQNVRFLLMVWQTLGDPRAIEALKRAMNVYVATQQPAPQAGWGSQHDAQTLRPIGARSYEPEALTPQTTARNIAMMLDFYEWTAEPRFIARLPEAFDWLESVRLAPEDIRMPGREFPTYVEIGTNRPLYSHRRGSNVVNGEYYNDYSPDDPIYHNAQWRIIDLAGLKARFEALRTAATDKLLAQSPLERRQDFVLPGFFLGQGIGIPAVPVTTLVETLNEEGYWPSPLMRISNPYIGDGPATPTPGDFSTSFVGDAYDTSPYTPEDPVIGISMRTFVTNMVVLINSLPS